MVKIQAKGCWERCPIFTWFLLSIRRSWVKVTVDTARVLQMMLFKTIKPTWCQTVRAQVPECQPISLKSINGESRAVGR